MPEAASRAAAASKALRRGWFGWAMQTGIPRITAGPRGDVDRDQPGVFERGGEHAGAALAEVIVAPAAVDPADARLKPDAAAEAGGPQDRADHLRPERRRHHAAGDRSSGATA